MGVMRPRSSTPAGVQASSVALVMGALMHSAEEYDSSASTLWVVSASVQLSRDSHPPIEVYASCSVPEIPSWRTNRATNKTGVILFPVIFTLISMIYKTPQTRQRD